MKKIILSAIIALLALCTASAHRGFNFQGVSQEKNKDITVVFEFIDAATNRVAYSEQHAVKTNADGVFSAVMGQGTPLTDGVTFQTLRWVDCEYKLRTSINGDVIATTDLHAVPYAKVAEKLQVPDELSLMNEARIQRVIDQMAYIEDKVNRIPNPQDAIDSVAAMAQQYINDIRAEVTTLVNKTTADATDQLYIKTSALTDSIEAKTIELTNLINLKTTALTDSITVVQYRCEKTEAICEEQKMQIRDLENTCKTLASTIDKLQAEIDKLKQQ